MKLPRMVVACQKGLVPKVIQQFAKVAPGLTRDQINHYKKKFQTPSDTAGSLSEAAATENLLQEDSDDPAEVEKRQKGGRPKGTSMKASQEELESYQKASAEAAQEYKKALYGNTGKRRMKRGLLQPHTLGTSRDHGHTETDTNSRKPTKFTRSNHS